MSKYSDLVAGFFDEYEQPTVQDYIVGFSGLDPDRKIKPEVIDHEQLYGLLGGAVAGHYHITSEQLQKLKAYEGQISALQSSLSAAIKTAENALSEAERVLGARITSTENTQTTLTQNQNALLNAVSGLQGSARDLTERMIGAENVQAALTASQRTLTQATEYIDAEEKKLAQRMSTAESVQSTLQAGQSTLSGRIDTLNATANTIAGRVSKTETAQASLEGTQAKFAVRLDTIQNEATTDTEILDARIDADNVPHVTLGDNVRSLHRLTVEQSERAHEVERVIAEYAREMVDDVAGMALDTRAILHDVKEDLSGVAGDVEDLKDRTYALEYGLEDETSGRMTADRALSERVDTVKGDLASEISQRKVKDSEIQADLNRANVSIAETITQLASEVTARKNAVARLDARDEEISGILEGEISDRENTDIATHEAIHAIFDYAREQSDITAGVLLDEILRRKQGELETVAELLHEATLRGDADREIQQGLDSESATREADISATRDTLKASHEYLRGGLDEISGAVLEHELRQKDRFAQLEDDIAHEASRNDIEHERLREDTASNAEGVIWLAGTFEDYTAKRRAEHDHETAQQTARNDQFRNDISELASGVVSVASEISRSNEQFRNDIEHERITREAEYDRLNEDTQQLAAGMIENATTIKNATDSIRGEFSHERGMLKAEIDELRQQADENALANVNNANTLHREIEIRREGYSHMEADNASRFAHVQEQINDTVLAEFRLMLDRLRAKAEIMNALDNAKKNADLVAEKHDEAEADLALAAIQNTRLIHDVAEKNRASKKADLAHIEGLSLSLSGHVQEQLDTLAEVCLSMMAGTFSRLRDMEKTIARINDEIASGLEGSADDEEIFESIQDIFAGNMTVTTSGDEDFDRDIYQIFGLDVNP